jgi:hypothetical protein
VIRLGSTRHSPVQACTRGFDCGACQTLRGQSTEVREAQVSVRDDKGAGGSNACNVGV